MLIQTIFGVLLRRSLNFDFLPIDCGERDYLIANHSEDAVVLELDFQVFGDRAVCFICRGHLKKPHSELITLENDRFVHGAARADPPAIGRLVIHANIGVEVETLVMLAPLTFNWDRYLFLGNSALQVDLQIRAENLAFEIISVPSWLHESLFQEFQALLKRYDRLVRLDEVRQVMWVEVLHNEDSAHVLVRVFVGLHYLHDFDDIFGHSKIQLHGQVHHLVMALLVIGRLPQL